MFSLYYKSEVHKSQLTWLERCKFPRRKFSLDQNSQEPIGRRYCEGEIMDVCSRMDVNQLEGDLPDFNQSEH